MPTHYKGNEPEVRALNALINLARALDSLGGRLSARLEEAGLTMPQFGVLEAVYHLGPMCQKELGQKLLRSGGNITVVVTNLEKRGLVRRERLANDRRMIRIHLTERGRERIERVFPEHVEALVREFSVLEPEEQETLRRLCRKLGTGCSRYRNTEELATDCSNKNGQVER
ncbi:MAG TPA: MarR family transcriptional regulator [Candidatus Acidoferrum sp.]|nr:MarR family transcriptional regulator [Candidatus Acidoferrum sp.]